MLLVLAFLCLVQVVYAGSPIQVISSEHHYVFSQSLDFTLKASSDSPIVEVILFYGREGDPLVRRIYPTFTAGKEIDAQFTEQLESGQYAPGTQLRSWWQLRTQDGSTLETTPEVFEYTDTNQDWHLLSGEQVDLFWYGNTESRAKDLLSSAEDALVRLKSNIGLAETRRVRIYVYNSQTDMSRALERRSEGYDNNVIALGVSVDERTLLLLGSHRDARQTVAHELSHIVVGLATDNPYAGLPRWLNEGLAMYAEGKLPDANQRALDAGVHDDSLLSVRSMSSYSGQASQVDLFYGEVYSVVDYMLKEYGRDKMSEFLRVFAQGTRQEDALQQVYGFGLDELDNRWRASLGLGPRQHAAAELTPSIEPTRTGTGPSSPQPTAEAQTPIAEATGTAAPLTPQQPVEETRSPVAAATRVASALTPSQPAPETVTPAAQPTRSGKSACASPLGAFLLPLLGGALWIGSRKWHGVR